MKRKALLAATLVVAILLPLAALTADDIDQHRSCAQCGMDRKAFGYSRMLIQYEDGALVGVCSLHCAVRELSLNPGRPAAKLLVADRASRALIDAAQAVWVMGGSKRGVMTQVPKWAFETQERALEFTKSHGGKIVPWEEARSAAIEELAKDRH